MKRFLLTSILMVAASFPALSQTPGETKTKSSPFAGTWKANLAKSQQHPNHRFESATIRFEVSDDAVLLTFTGVNMAGVQESGSRKLRPDGIERELTEAPGVVEITRWVSSHILETVAKKDGKVIGEGSYEVSSDGKTLTATVKGIDASGQSFEQIIVFERVQSVG
jgi:hypothetical protein